MARKEAHALTLAQVKDQARCTSYRNRCWMYDAIAHLVQIWFAQNMIAFIVVVAISGAFSLLGSHSSTHEHQRRKQRVLKRSQMRLVALKMPRCPVGAKCVVTSHLPLMAAYRMFFARYCDLHPG